MNNTRFFKKTVVTKNSIEEYKYALGSAVSSDRCNRCKPTTEAQAACNLRQATKNLGWLISENFGTGDYFITLTYEGDNPTEEEARMTLDYFLRNMRALYKKASIPFRYISKTERGRGTDRIHHHLIINRCSNIKGALYWCWFFGWYKVEVIDGSDDYHKRLAGYLTTPKGSRPAMKQLYNRSHNLTEPQIIVKEITEPEFHEAPESTYDTENGSYNLVESSFQSTEDCMGKPYCCYYYTRHNDMNCFEWFKEQPKTYQKPRRYCGKKPKKNKNAAKKARRKNRKK